ncbi:DNA repair protein recA homolog 2, mitochondrial isoform X5 [Asparagus officinalis]|uniref:DNA repair protein recA homolog 2, mitochondrial isoform X5 n=1 Tax=Asparagus officinalis TaxID=4686 RepID=UPI00098DE64E|nr:DNA repair protein recA homolog 2, mitochondrial isoform X5 [Asparagus officinalis]XP_020267125.1 DNA repair protein recA homolog 2, mitochondrial isoform X5 [Asparagus officinalis]
MLETLEESTMFEFEELLKHSWNMKGINFMMMKRFSRTRYTPVISTGSLKLDLALGIGGLPKGRIVEIYGREASGKTTLALHIVKEAQKLGGCCAYLDVENALNGSFADGMGINTKDLLVVHPNSAENSLSILDTLVNSGSVDVIIVDSVAALVPQCELDGLIDIYSHDAQSRLMNQALRKIHLSLSRSQTLVIFVNQIRTRSAVDTSQRNEVTCGGNALKFYSAIRMRITRRNLLHTEDKITGVGISVQVMKNKLSRSMKTADLDIEFGRGLRHEAEVLEMASKHGIAMREGDGYWINGNFFENQIKAEVYLKEKIEVADELVAALRSQLFEMVPEDE